MVDQEKKKKMRREWKKAPIEQHLLSWADGQGAQASYAEVQQHEEEAPQLLLHRTTSVRSSK